MQNTRTYTHLLLLYHPPRRKEDYQKIQMKVLIITVIGNPLVTFNPAVKWNKQWVVTWFSQNKLWVYKTCNRSAGYLIKVIFWMTWLHYDSILVIKKHFVNLESTNPSRFLWGISKFFFFFYQDFRHNIKSVS